ncbi:MAG: PQQ-binding-like beta-propeller repeat protein [Planctomycetaceae bacterium]
MICDRNTPATNLLCLLAIGGGWLLMSDVCRSQPPQAIDLREEDPERRKILRLLEDLQEIQPGQTTQAADAFDAAWEMAVRREDPLLNLKTEVQQSLEPGQSELFAGARARLLQIFENAPAEFRRTYQQQVGHRAEDALKQALSTSSISDLTQMILRFQFTQTGQQALQHLIQLRLSRGEYLQAALQYGRLLRLQRDESHVKRTILAMLWWKAGLPEEAVDYLRDVVSEHAGQKIDVAGKSLNLPEGDSDLRRWLSQATIDGDRTDDPPQGNDPARDGNWNQPLGNYRRSQLQDIGPAWLKPIWSSSLFRCLEHADLNPLLEAASVNMDLEIESRRDVSNTVLPVALPIAVNDLLIFRTVANLRAVHRLTGDVVWETFFVDRQLLAAQDALRKAGDDAPLEIDSLQDKLLNHWTRASGGGQLTCDGRTVFVVEEISQETMQLDVDNRLPPSEKNGNYLRAYSAESGMLRGQAGGPMGLSGGGQANPLAGMFFLGAPLVMGDRIYVIAESDQGIFLLQLRATPMYVQADGEVDMRPVRSQLLSIPRHPLAVHPVRKYAGIIPSYGRGLLICSTCDEQIVAISAEDHSIRWMYRYPTNVAVPELNRELAVLGHAFSPQESDRIDMATRWTDSLPRIAGDRVLLTPRDADRMFCLDLLTGRELWTRPRGAMRTIVAVSEDRVVLTGNQQVECLDMQTGLNVWTTELDAGRVSGTSISTGRVLQIPTSAPAVVTLDLQTGRRMAVQTLEETPGNLLSRNGRLYSQSVTAVTCLGPDPDAPPSLLVRANQHLLSGNVAEAEAALQTAMTDGTPAEQLEAREMMIRTLLESVRQDYATNADRVPELQALIDAGVPEEQQVMDAVGSMLGMTLVDAAMLPLHWSRISRARQQSSRLQSIVSRGQLQNADEAPDVLGDRILQMLDQAFDSRTSYVVSGTMAVRSPRLPVALIRRSMRLRPPEIVTQVSAIVDAGLKQRLVNASSPEDAQWWAEVSLLAGFPQAVVDATGAGDVTFPSQIEGSLKDSALMLSAGSSDSPTAGQSVETLLTTWEGAGRILPTFDLLQRTQQRVLRESLLPGDHRSAVNIHQQGVLPVGSIDADVLTSRLESLRSKRPALPWQGIPGVSESDARSALSGAAFSDSGAVYADIPLYGSPGMFGGWVFVQTRPSQSTVTAFDADGRLRWSYDPGRFVSGGQRSSFGGRNVLYDQYLLACGNLLALKLDSTLIVVDCADASVEQPPKLLWRQNIRAALQAASDAQLYPPAWTRTDQYDMQPSGLFPVGPFTPSGISVYSGRQMVLLNAFSGQREWQVHGLPDDGTLTATDDELLLISEGSGQVEVRDIIDGSVKTVTALPDWWTDANENSNSSVHTFELEEGDELRVRKLVQSDGALIQRRNIQASALERYNLQTGETDWSIPLPADTLVSNVDDNHVAVLADGKRLQIYDTLTGTRVADMDVPEAPAGLYLYLRRSGGQWLVITDVFDPEHDEQNIAGESVIVSGQVYSVRQQDGSLSWSRPILHESLRMLRPGEPHGPLPPVAPFLTLLRHPYPPAGPNGLRRGPVVYKVKVLDVRTGQMLYEDEDVGQNLNYHWLRFNVEKNSIDLSFDKRILTFDYSVQKP